MRLAGGRPIHILPPFRVTGAEAQRLSRISRETPGKPRRARADGNGAATPDSSPAGDRMRPLLSPEYRPSEKEAFMNPLQVEYFRQKLLSWKSELLRESSETLNHLQTESLSEADIADRASQETDRTLELRTRERERKLIQKIDEALERIDTGSYGFCEETGEPIALKRLEARPIATLSIEAQERHERMERTHRED